MDALVKPVSFLLIVIAGYIFKRTGFFSKDDYKILSRVVLTLTLPAAIVTSFSDYTRDTTLFLLVLLGFVCGIVPTIIMLLITRKQEYKRRVYSIIGVVGLNVGTFSLPLIQHFFGNDGAVVACMFDVGNGIMLLGGAYIIVTTALRIEGDERETPKMVLKKLFSSVPLVASLIMLVLMIFNIHLPVTFFQLISPIAGANSFVALFMLGMMIEPARNREHVRSMAYVVVFRLLFATMFSLLFFYLTPFSLPARQALAVATFSPMSSLNSIYTQKAGGDGALSSFTNSITSFISIIIMTGMVMVMGVTTPS